jgi:hypothetical protein
VNARVQACFIYVSLDYGRISSLRKRSGVLCKLDYRAEGAERENIVRIGDAISADDKSWSFPGSKLTVATMQDWIARHPSGSFLAIRYDPSNPANVVLAGEKRELRLATPYERLWFGIFACAGGLVIVAVGGLSRRDPGQEISRQETDAQLS